MRRSPRGHSPASGERGTSMVELLVVASLLVLVLGTLIPLLEIGRLS